MKIRIREVREVERNFNFNDVKKDAIDLDLAKIQIEKMFGLEYDADEDTNSNTVVLDDGTVVTLP